MKVDLGKQVALVTGAARHIGKAIGDVYADNGAAVIYTDVQFDDAPSSAGSAPNRRTVIMNVGDEAQVEHVIDGVLREFGRLDIVVNNAGLMCPPEQRTTIDQFSRDQWDKIVHVDLTGVYLVSRAAAKAMIRQGSGRIINVASVAGLVPLKLQCAYNAAKAGVINLTQAIASELGPKGIRCNCIAPGSILTDVTRKLFYGDGGELSEKAKQMLAHIPLGQPGRVEDIAYAALYLAAPESAYVNGHCLTVDGGWTAGFLRDF